VNFYEFLSYLKMYFRIKKNKKIKSPNLTGPLGAQTPKP
jgi:hypothetical protein